MPIDIGDSVTALHEVELLLAMLHGRDGPYIEWLTRVERRLKMSQLDKKRKS
jgi:hypothetical protein